jgi:hypothetical protein
LNDAWSKKFDCAVVVSNDSDLSEALKIVKTDLKKVVGVINPRNERPSLELLRHATFHKVIRKGLLAISQLPESIPGTNLRKPLNWNKKK